MYCPEGQARCLAQVFGLELGLELEQGLEPELELEQGLEQGLDLEPELEQAPEPERWVPALHLGLHPALVLVLVQGLYLYRLHRMR